ncbi:hypothetical protein REPUB_Repub02eG0105900 [Reevesia pubescens]
MGSVLRKVWRVSGGLQVREVGSKLFLFHFNDSSEKDRVFLSQPWFVNRSILVLNEFNVMDQVEKIQLDWCSLWVQIHGISNSMMNERIGMVVGESLGDVEEVDKQDGSMAWGKFLRVRVIFNVTKALNQEQG